MEEGSVITLPGAFRVEQSVTEGAVRFMHGGWETLSNRDDHLVRIHLFPESRGHPITELAFLIS